MQFVSANVPHLSDQSSIAPARALHRRAFGLFPAQYLVTSAQRRFLGRRLGITMQESHQRGRQEFFRVRVHYIIAVLAIVCLSWSSIATADYKYPYRDPYLATATTAILSDNGATPRLKSQVVHVPGLPGRNQLPSLEGRGDVSIALYRQKHPAPLLFILAGIGSNPYFGVAPG